MADGVGVNPILSNPQYAALLKAAMTNAKGSSMSGLLNNIDNPLWGILTGGYDPRTFAGQQQGGDLWSQYDSEDAPAAIQAIMGRIERGDNEYEVQAFIDGLNDSSLQSTGLGDPEEARKRLYDLSSDLTKEYRKGSEEQDDFAKMGLPSPLERYSDNPALIPMTDKLAKLIGAEQRKVDLYAGAQFQAQKDYDTQMKLMGDLLKGAQKKAKEEIKGEEGFFEKRNPLRVFGDIANLPRDVYDTINNVLEMSPITGKNVYKGRTELEQEKRSAQTQRDRAAVIAEETGAFDPMNPRFVKMREIGNKIAAANIARQQAEKAQGDLLAGAVDKLESQGRTPLMDALVARLSGVQNTSKPKAPAKKKESKIDVPTLRARL